MLRNRRYADKLFTLFVTFYLVYVPFMRIHHKPTLHVDSGFMMN